MTIAVRNDAKIFMPGGAQARLPKVVAMTQAWMMALREPRHTWPEALVEQLLKRGLKPSEAFASAAAAAQHSGHREPMAAMQQLIIAGIALIKHQEQQAVEATARVDQAETAARNAAREARNATGDLHRLRADYDLRGHQLREERGHRRRAEASPAAPAQAPDDTDLRPEVEHLRGLVLNASADRDLFEGLLTAAEDERDTAIRAREAALAQLHATGQPVPAPADTELAEGYDSLARLLVDDEYILVTADPAEADAIDSFPSAPAWRTRLAATLDTMRAYAAQKAALPAGEPTPAHLVDLAAFVRAGGPGVLISSSTVAMVESTRMVREDRFAKHRVFPVPDHVHPSGRMTMVAHIRIGSSGKPPAPRLYFLEHAGRIIIGYMGAHLPNSQTRNS